MSKTETRTAVFAVDSSPLSFVSNKEEITTCVDTSLLLAHSVLYTITEELFALTLNGLLLSL